MQIESLSLRNFRCFGDTKVAIQFEPGITGFVGDNGAGKTSTLEALKRLFSPIASERKLKKADVHFGAGEDSQSVVERDVVVDVVFNFNDPEVIPHVFSDMFFNASDSSLKVRLILEGRYIKSEAYEDDVETKLYTVRTLEDVPFGDEDDRKTPFSGRSTQFAELVYIPAQRNSLGVTRHALKNVLTRLERSADWDDETKKQSQDFAKTLEKNLNAVPAIATVTGSLKSFWTSLHDGHYDSDPVISVVATEFEQLVRDLTLRFEKSPGGGQRQLEELSEGQVSLLYFALSATLHSLIWKMDGTLRGETPSLPGFKPLDFVPAPLTIFALEEPENHLAPYYLPRLIGLIEGLLETGTAQSFVTSHSPSVLRRIPPRNVRYIRNCRVSLTSGVRALPLPEKDSDDDKFVHQVILSNPEIYFSRLVIVGEGDSERIVIPKIAEVFEIPLDPSFVAFVPIGGRHAQHLWKLLAGLNIPCLTLLDLDLGRHGGGMGRIRNAVDWLKQVGHDFGEVTVPANEELNGDVFKQWTDWLADNFGIVYSTPLDIDMMMLQAFPDAYKVEKSYDKNTDDAGKGKIVEAVFGKGGKGNDDIERIDTAFSYEELFAYQYLFKSRSKPASHYFGLSQLDAENIKEKCPEPLRKLVELAKNHFQVAAASPEEKM